MDKSIFTPDDIYSESDIRKFNLRSVIETISKNPDLKPMYIFSNMDWLDINLLSQYLPSHTLDLFIEYLNPHIISRRLDLPIEFIEKHLLLDHLNKYIISQRDDLPVDFFMRNIKYLDRYSLNKNKLLINMLPVKSIVYEKEKRHYMNCIIL